MKAKSICLNAEALRKLASDEFSPEELRLIESHLDQCPQCRELLDREFSVSWLETGLSDAFRFDAQSLGAPQSSATALDEETKASANNFDHICKLLGPTDDPHRLGRIDSYEIIGIIGRGGMGVVFKAFDPALQRFVAIKMLLPHLAESAVARKRFAREAKAAAAVVDDFVLPIHGVAEWRGLPYIVMQYCRGETLQKRIDQCGILETKEILRISIQIAKGLAAAHSQGLVHRDVKPSNILLDRGIERVQLTDFGLARTIDDATMTHTGILAGTPQFMSPEQAHGQPLDGRSDLFALGSVIYTMCTGRPPFRGTQPLAILQKIANERHKPIQLQNADIPRRLAGFVDRLLEKKPADRIQTAEEAAKWLEGYLAYLQHPTRNSKPRLPSSSRLRKRGFVIGASVMLVAASLIMLWIGLKRGDTIKLPSHSTDLSGGFSPNNQTIPSALTNSNATSVTGFGNRLEGFAAFLRDWAQEEQAWTRTRDQCQQLNNSIERFAFEINKPISPRDRYDRTKDEILQLQSQIYQFEQQSSDW